MSQNPSSSKSNTQDQGPSRPVAGSGPVKGPSTSKSSGPVKGSNLVDSSDLLITLLPIKPKDLIEKSFKLSHNSNRYIESATGGIELRSGVPPKDQQKGYIFGTDENFCDVLLKDDKRTVGRQHFRITANESGRVILENMGGHATSVSYDGEGKDQSRSTNFEWILFLPHATNVHVHLGNGVLNFMVKFANQASSRSFEKGVLGQSTSALSRSNPNAGPPLHRIFVIKNKQSPIGSGTFSTVYAVVDVSTAKTYAGKHFIRNQQEQDKKRINKEVRIMRSSSHHVSNETHSRDRLYLMDFLKDNIVKYEHFTGHSLSPLLVTEYLGHGTLLNRHTKQNPKLDKSTRQSEIPQILQQMLKALEFVHSQGYMHRDVKLDNILIKGHNPFHVVLADFGSASEENRAVKKARGPYGALMYLAPEIFDGQFNSYTNVVDIWALAIVLLQYLESLPPRDKINKAGRERGVGQVNRVGLKWCEDIIEHHRQAGTEVRVLDVMLRDYLLVKDPSSRSSAKACLKRGDELELFTTV